MKAQKERLYRLIRKEDVLIWTGAGFSKYAGLPTGPQLAKIIYDSLSKEEKKLIGSKIPNLDELTEKYIRIRNGSRTDLNKILLDTFKREPTSLECHKKVANIPHFKSIVTTNYDTLFESAYIGNSISICWKNEQIPYIESRKTVLYKIHGCISDLNSIILSKDDYKTFIQRDLNTPFWSSLIALLSTKNILFLGYGYEDQNVWQIFDKIKSLIGQHQKEIFLIAPSIKPHDRDHLIRKGFTVIKETAQQFLDGLLKNIQDNIINDFKNDNVSVETFNSVLGNHNLSATYEQAQNRIEIKAIGGIVGNTNGIMKLVFKDSNRKMFLDELLEDDKEEINISAKQLKDFEMTLEGIKMPFSNRNFGFLSVRSRPSLRIPFDIRFPGKNFELLNLNADIYPKLHKVKCIINYEFFKFEVFVSTDELLQSNLKVNAKFPDVYADVSTALNGLQLYYYLLSSEEFQIYNRTLKSTSVFSFPGSYLEKSRIDLEMIIEYFKLLRIIEDHYQIRFIDIGNISNKELTTSRKIVGAITEEKKELSINGEIKMTFDFSVEMKERLIVLNNTKDLMMSYIHQKEKNVELHGKNFSLGYDRTEFILEKITNLNDFLEEKTNEITISVKNSKIWKSYSKKASLVEDIDEKAIKID